MRPLSLVSTLVRLGPRAWAAGASWPVFSATSYEMVWGLVQQGLKPATVIDVGANVGQFAVAAARIMKPARIVSFEPDPDTFRVLSKHVARERGATPVNKALGDAPGTLALHRNTHGHSSSLLRLAAAHRQAFPFAEELGEVLVEVSTLDRELAAARLERPTLLKIDVQGYEDRVLAGGMDLLAQVDWIVMEVSFRPLYAGEPTFMEVLPTMERRGFEFLRPVGWLGAAGTGEILQMDALFARR